MRYSDVCSANVDSITGLEFRNFLFFYFFATTGAGGGAANFVIVAALTAEIEHCD